MLDIDSKVSFSKLNPQRMVKLPLSDKYLQSVCNYLLNTFSPGPRVCLGCVQGGQGLVLLMGQSKHPNKADVKSKKQEALQSQTRLLQ